MERLLLFVLLLVGCTSQASAESSRSNPALEQAALAMVQAFPGEDDELDAEAPDDLEDPYAAHDAWCEDLYKQTCECSTQDSIVCEQPKEPCGPDRTGRPQHCVRPKWARKEGSNVYVCDQPWLNRRQQRQERDSQQAIVDEVCSWPGWAEKLSAWGRANRYGGGPSKLCWHLPGSSKELKTCRGKHFCQPDKLAKFMALVAARESTWNNTTTHELNLDVEANRRAYAKARKQGWYEDNPHFHNADRWARGYGWYGFNAALHVFYWDNLAPPEILCRKVESTLVYLRKARAAFRKLWSKYGDHVERLYKLDTGEEVKVKGVTWYDVHRAASSGKLDPEEVIRTRAWNKKKQKWIRIGFVSRARAKRIQLDPFETVMWEMLGEPIDREQQNAIADVIRQQVFAVNDGDYSSTAAGG